jgi:hypothetical protein
MLYQEDTEMLFPPRVIPMLRDLRGAEWRQLIDEISQSPVDDPDILGFMLMMVRLNGCMTCHADSYRAMRGCTLCAQQAITRFKGSDRDLIALWESARQDIISWQNAGVTPNTD